MPEKDSTIESWVKLAQEGDKSAFADLYEHFFDSIYRYVYFRVAPSEVDDIVETVFVKVWTKLPSYESRDVGFNAWIFRIAHNAVIDHRRTHKSLLPIDPSLPDEAPKNAPKAITHERLLAEELRVEIEALKDPYRQVVSLKFLSGLDNAEIAEILGEREGNIRVIQHRALKMLKERFEAKGFKPEFL